MVLFVEPHFKLGRGVQPGSRNFMREGRFCEQVKTATPFPVEKTFSKETINSSECYWKDLSGLQFSTEQRKIYRTLMSFFLCTYWKVSESTRHDRVQRSSNLSHQMQKDYMWTALRWLTYPISVEKHFTDWEKSPKCGKSLLTVNHFADFL